jgi:hypothetical protein
MAHRVHGGLAVLLDETQGQAGLHLYYTLLRINHEYKPERILSAIRPMHHCRVIRATVRHVVFRSAEQQSFVSRIHNCNHNDNLRAAVT